MTSTGMYTKSSHSDNSKNSKNVHNLNLDNKRIKNYPLEVEFSFEKYVRKMGENQNMVLEGSKSLEVYRSLQKVPETPSIHSTEMDGEDLYRMEIIENIRYTQTSLPYESDGNHEGQIHIEALKKMFPEAPSYQKFYNPNEAVLLSNKIVASGKPNFVGEKIEVKSGFNIPAF